MDETSYEKGAFTEGEKVMKPKTPKHSCGSGFRGRIIIKSIPIEVWKNGEYVKVNKRLKFCSLCGAEFGSKKAKR